MLTKVSFRGFTYSILTPVRRDPTGPADPTGTYILKPYRWTTRFL